MKAVSLLSLAFYVVLTTANHNRSIIEPRIVGGQKAEVGQFKYQGCLRTRLTKQYICGAAIISNRFLLTAAHCTDGIYQHPGMVVAVVGAMHRYKDGVTMKVDKITKHNKYNFRLLHHDISLIRTVDEINFSPTVQPIALPTKDSPKDGNAHVVLSGWGRISFPDLDETNDLQYAEAHTITFDDCYERFKGNENLMYLKESMICAIGKEGIGTCHGDSGGPLVDITRPSNAALVGIVSWGIPCAQGYPDVFTRVYSYIDWIKETMEAQSTVLETF